MRKKSVVLLFALVFLFAGLAAVVRFRHNAVSEDAAEVFAVPTTNKVIIIDAGHGGVDAGAVANGVEEKNINLQIALKLQEYIEQSGGVAILTRDSDESTQDPNRSANISQKKSDLMERKAAMEKYNADIFISIHMNKFEQEKYRGAQVFYAANGEESKRLGEIIQQSLKEVLADGNTREAKKSGSNIYILKNAAVPSALVECGFLSNAEEARLLQSEEYQQKVAWGIYIGIVKYFL